MREGLLRRTSFDTIVIGGGPAGALAAYLLAKQGQSVAIIERGDRNRLKTCGHCLSPRAVPVLRRAGLLERVCASATGYTTDFRVHATGCPSVSLTLDVGLVVERSTFDQVLLDAAEEAGAHVLQPASARLERPSGPETTVTVTTPVGRAVLTAPLIVGADGLGSRVARFFGAMAPHRGGKFGFSFDVAGHVEVPAGAIEMFVVEGGYLGLVVHSQARVHVAALVDAARPRLPRDPQAFLKMAASQFEELRALQCLSHEDLIHFAATGPLPWRPSPDRISGAKYALIGDAAGYVEPFTGEGISWALDTAEILADVTSDVRPGLWDARLASRYRKLWRDRIGRGHRRCAAVAWSLNRRWTRGAASFLATASPTLAGRFARRVVAA